MTYNLYWPVYQNLERELLELANQIHFDDQQVNVYSVKLAELLMRCSTEIESISKALYKDLGGDMCPIDTKTGQKRSLYFDTDCIDLLQKNWFIGEKEVGVVAKNFYFTDDKYCKLTPLHNANKRDRCSWKKAYQAVKHNRTENLCKATVGNVIQALGALYLLNIYYMNETLKSPKPYVKTVSNTSFDSDIFSVFATHEIPDCVSAVMEKDGYKKYTYLMIADEHKLEEIRKIQVEGMEKAKSIVLSAISEATLRGEEISSNKSNLIELAYDIGGIELVRRVIGELPHIVSYAKIHRTGVLNKHQMVYGKNLPEPEYETTQFDGL